MCCAGLVVVLRVDVPSQERPSIFYARVRNFDDILIESSFLVVSVYYTCDRYYVILGYAYLDPFDL